MNRPLLVGLVGYAGTGKDTIAAHLCKRHHFVQVSFARKLKELISEVFGVPIEHFEDRVLKNAMHPCLHRSTIEHDYFDEAQFADALVPPLAELYGVDEAEVVVRGWHKTAANFLLNLLPEDGCSPRRAAQLIGTEGFRNQIRTTTWVDYAMRKAMDVVRGGTSVVISDVRFPDEFDAVSSHSGYLWAVKRDTAEQHNHASEQHIGKMREQCDTILVNNGSIKDVCDVVDAKLNIVENTHWTRPFNMPFQAIEDCAISHGLFSDVQLWLWGFMTQHADHKCGNLLDEMLEDLAGTLAIVVRQEVDGRWVASLEK